MKTHKFTAIVAIMLMGLFMASCDEEKDIIVIDGNIPIKTSTLYIVGDATPALWDVNNMYPLEMSEEDHLVFIYDGILSQGELKAYLTQGSWDQAPCSTPDDSRLTHKQGRQHRAIPALHRRRRP